MSKSTDRPETRVKNPEPEPDTESWIVWAAWADRITFEEIHERTGYTEAQVITLMRRSLKTQSFKRWRARVHKKVSIKHRRRFELERREARHASARAVTGALRELEASSASRSSSNS